MKPACALVLLAAGCGSSGGLRETRLVRAAPRLASCGLEFVQPDVSSIAFDQSWEVLGYVTLTDPPEDDPLDRENRALVRPRACAMGGTSVAIAAGATGGLAYMVLRPKTKMAPPMMAF